MQKRTLARGVSTDGAGTIMENSSQKLDFNPLYHPICARVPDRHDVLSAWNGHIPFAMCLMDLAKPRVFVELGTHWGVSYCAFCQAVRELGLSTQCYAVDSWEGDPHASFYTSEVYSDLKAYHDPRYSHFSKLLKLTCDGALSRFQDGTVDVLHIDGYHTYEAVTHDFESWLPKLSEQAVVLFHDTNVRDRDTFGVWRFWDGIKDKYPSFEFLHSYGLGVIAVGERLPEPMRDFFNMPSERRAEVQQFFTNLGDHLTELNNSALQLENLQEILDTKIEEIGRIQASLSASVSLRNVLHRDVSRIRHQAVSRTINVAKQIPGLRPIVRSARSMIRLVRAPISRHEQRPT
jgi:hypothetical protein